MEETALKSTEHLINYGVAGIFCVILLVALVWLARHYLTREKHHEKKYEVMQKEQTDLTLKFTEMTSKFRESQVDNTGAIRELRDVIHSKL